MSGVLKRLYIILSAIFLIIMLVGYIDVNIKIKNQNKLLLENKSTLEYIIKINNEIKIKDNNLREINNRNEKIKSLSDENADLLNKKNQLEDSIKSYDNKNTQLKNKIKFYEN